MDREQLAAFLPPWDAAICTPCAEHMETAGDYVRRRAAENAKRNSTTRREATVAYFERYHEGGH